MHVNSDLCHIILLGSAVGAVFITLVHLGGKGSSPDLINQAGGVLSWWGFPAHVLVVIMGCCIFRSRVCL